MLAALVLLLGLALLIGWEILCLGQVVLAGRVRFLPRWLWAVACLIFIPLGGILYLLVGRVWTRSAKAGTYCLGVHFIVAADLDIPRSRAFAASLSDRQ